MADASFNNLSALGDEGVVRGFFAECLSSVYGSHGGHAGNNGKIDTHMRLTYVLDRNSGMPVYFSLCSGNIVDSSTLCETLAELSQYGVAVDCAIVDAEHFSQENITDLYLNGVRFVARLASNRKIYAEIAESELDGILSAEHAVRFGNRLVYMKKRQIDLYGHVGYAYVGVDMDSRNQEFMSTAFAAIDDSKTPDEMDRELGKLGAFVLVSSDDIETKEILALYSTRQQLEQVFGIGKNHAYPAPIRVQNENTLRGISCWSLWPQPYFKGCKGTASPNARRVTGRIPRVHCTI